MRRAVRAAALPVPLLHLSTRMMTMIPVSTACLCVCWSSVLGKRVALGIKCPACCPAVCVAQRGHVARAGRHAAGWAPSKPFSANKCSGGGLHTVGVRPPPTLMMCLTLHCGVPCRVVQSRQQGGIALALPIHPHTISAFIHVPAAQAVQRTCTDPQHGGQCRWWGPCCRCSNY